MTEREKLALLEDVFELEEGELTPTIKLEDIEEYDSMTKLSLIVMVEDEFGIKLSSSDIRGFKTVGDILARLQE